MPPKGEEKSIFDKDLVTESILLIFILILIGGLISRFQYVDLSSVSTLWSEFIAWLSGFWLFFKILALLIIGLCLWWSVYNIMRRDNIEKEEEKVYGVIPKNIFIEPASPTEKENKKWTQVLAHLNSINPSDWRLAIIEADIMLDELLTVNGYHGDSIGDKLKGVEPGDMKTLDAAWEAHKVRNRIAHSGSDFELSEREAKRVIALFEQVFKEYQII